jgi:transposase
LTLVQCHELIAGLSLQVELLSQQLVARDELLAVLQERLKLDSKNSSKPASSDGPGSGGNRQQRRASERQRGAQKGHEGTSRALLDESQVHPIVECEPAQPCPTATPPTPTSLRSNAKPAGPS